jgi:type I restriction enzyme, S subunit
MSKVCFGDIVRDVKINVDRTNNPYDYYVAGDHMDTEELRILRRGRFSEPPEPGPAFTHVFKPGQILYGSRRTYLKKVAVADFEGVCANTTFVLETKDDNVFLQQLLPFLMYSEKFTQYSINNSKGSTNPYILFSDLAKYEFDLPPITRQRKLADLLWALNTTREAYKKLLNFTDEIVKSRFVEMFGDPVMNDKGWPVKPIKTFATVRIGPFGSLLHAEDYVENGIPLVNPSHIVNSKIMIDPKMTLSTNKYKTLSSYILQTGDVILGRRGEIGRCAVVDNGEYMCGTGSMFIRIKADYLPMMLQKIISSDAVRRVLENRAVGVTMQNLNAEIIAELMVIMPPLPLQNRFAEFVRQADKSKFAALIQTKSAKLLYNTINGG